MTRLPIVLSVPHGGLEVPGWLAGNCLLSPEQILKDGDEGASEIYSLQLEVERFTSTPIARAVLDMNRSEGDDSKDGIVKTHTCWDEPVWSRPLSSEEEERLLAEHYRPYHAALTEAASSVRLGVDAHTMAATAPPVAPDAGRRRPAACLSNADGTCPDEWLRVLASVLREKLGEVRINDPFRGGFITRSHAAELPWLQLELSRAPDKTIREKREAVLNALLALASIL